MRIEFLDPAFIEYKEAIDYYDLQIKGMSNKFISEIDRTISIIKNYPESYSLYTKHTRKATVSIFPYNIIYSIGDEIILIIAIAHQHRKPNYWSKRKAQLSNPLQ
jgi:hypothetical protein